MKKKHITLISIASLITLAATTAFLILKRRKAIADGDLPPAGAPQVPIQNPGDQSEFLAGPSGEPGLG